jgi:cytochrome c peroxidase
MRTRYVISICVAVVTILSASFKQDSPPSYSAHYHSNLEEFTSRQLALLALIEKANTANPNDIKKIRASIDSARIAMKSMDFWLRYMEPLAYKKINGPLPVEWETEVFEKFEKPYRREGAGLTLAALYLEEPAIKKDSLLQLVRRAISATASYAADSITGQLGNYDHFFLCNRLFLLNLAAIYTTGFECPDADRTIPELTSMLSAVGYTYQSFNSSFPATPISTSYLRLFSDLLVFINKQPMDNTSFDHYTFIRDYVNPLFVLNQQFIEQYKVVSHSLVDYSLNKSARSIFDKKLYNGQNAKGIFIRVTDSAALAQVEKVGKLLFYDPALSGNNMRSCGSCHKPAQHFTDTSAATSLHFNRNDHLTRNSPSLVNCVYNHLVMLDGKHFTLQNQAKAVISNTDEMACNEYDVIRKVLSCKEYKNIFSKLVNYTPQEKEITYDHIVSSITYYYSRFSNYYAPFDNAMNRHAELTLGARAGFNLFMGKAQCATCHFAPQFNGVKPPYVSSEFEVLGVPKDTGYSHLSNDEGRHGINPATETRNAFRTGSLRNAMQTQPYMHNGVFRTMEEVIEFYNAGGGAGHGLTVTNQTLSADSLKLTAKEKSDLLTFIRSLDEDIPQEKAPAQLPKSKIKILNTRKPGGEY